MSRQLIKIENTEHEFRNKGYSEVFYTDGRFSGKLQDALKYCCELPGYTNGDEIRLFSVLKLYENQHDIQVRAEFKLRLTDDSLYIMGLDLNHYSRRGKLISETSLVAQGYSLDIPKKERVLECIKLLGGLTERMSEDKRIRKRLTGSGI